MRLASWLAVVVFCGFALGGVAQEYERILLPVVAAESPGGYGSLWKTFLVMHNGGNVAGRFEYPFGCPLGTCPRGIDIPPFTTDDTEAIIPPPVSTPGLLVYVERPMNERFSFNLRAQDLSRQALTWGTELPVVRETEFRAGVTTLLNVPLDDRFRQMLRVYDVDAIMPSAVRVRIITTDHVQLAELTLSLEPYMIESGPRPFHPRYTSIGNLANLPELEGQSRVHVEITPLTPGLRYWAFVSVTNNETQHVTTITPQGGCEPNLHTVRLPGSRE